MRSAIWSNAVSANSSSSGASPDAAKRLPYTNIWSGIYFDSAKADAMAGFPQERF
jgi:hypothetical protein